MDFWSLFKTLLGGFDFESPRDMLLQSNGSNLLNPTDPNLLTQQYFDLLSTVAAVCLPLLILELVVRGFYGLTHSRFGEEMTSWSKTMFFALILIPSLPGAVLTVKGLFDVTGSFILGMTLGTTDRSLVIKALSELTGTGPLDFFLNPLQTVFLFVLFLEFFVVVAMVFATALVLTVGVLTRWMGDFGASMFRFSLTFSLFGVALNFILLMIFAVDFALQRLLFANSQVGKGALNTVAIIVAAFVIPSALKSLKPLVVAVGQSAGRGMKNLRSRVAGNNGPIYDENGSTGRSSLTLRSLERRQSRAAERSSDASENDSTQKRGWRRGSGSTSSKPAGANDSGTSGNSHETGTSSSPRSSSTASRSRPGRKEAVQRPERNQSDSQPDGSPPSPVVETAHRTLRRTPQELNASHRRSTVSPQGSTATERRGTDSSAGGPRSSTPIRTRS